MLRTERNYITHVLEIYNEDECIAHVDDFRGNVVEYMKEHYPDYTYCDWCGQYEENDKISAVDNHKLCRKCLASFAHKCDYCGRYTLRYRHTVDTDKYCCPECRRTHTHACAICEDLYEKLENMVIMEDFDLPICKDCDPDYFSVINDYHTMKDNGNYTFYTDAPRSDKLCMGFELETTSGNEDEDSRVPYANHVAHIFKNFLKFENDCSIGDGGFEMISQPASLDYLMSLGDKFKEAWDYLSKNGYTSHNSGCCGLHIHVDRQFFGAQEDSCIAKIIFLMMKYKNQFMKFSRRKESQLEWCEMFSRNSDIPLLVKTGRDGSRYMALNLTNNNTLEFRLWRGTLNYATFIATLKFTNRICNLVKDTGIIQLNQMSWEDILGDDDDIKAYWQTRLNR